MPSREHLEQTRIGQRLKGVVVGLLCLILASCGGNQGSGNDAASRVTRLQLDVQPLPAERRRLRDGQSRQISPGDPGYVERLQVTVTAQDIANPIQLEFELVESQQQTFSSRFEVPIGRDRTVNVKAFNRDGTSIFHGATQVNLTEEEAFCEPMDGQAATTTEMSAELICHLTLRLERDDFIPIGATVADLDNLSFTFDGANPFGISSSPVTLSIGPIASDEANGAPFLLSAAEGTASGTLTDTQTGCQMTVHLSTFPTQLGPQTGAPLEIDLCQIDAVDGRLLTADADTTTQSMSHPPTVLENQAPILINPGPQLNHEGETINETFVASDVNRDPLVFLVTGLPPGIQVDTTTGHLTGQLSPSASAGSPYTVAVSVSDGTVDIHTSFTWTINRPAWGQFSWGEARWNPQSTQSAINSSSNQ